MTLSSLNYLKKIMLELDLEPKRSLGQNFLISDHVIEKIILAVDQSRPASIIEVGPGLGALTRFLLKFHENLQVIELDRRLSEYWTHQGVKVIEADALQLNWNHLEFKRPITLVSNLPYQISSSLLIERSLDEIQLDCMVLMFQKEVAQRIKADSTNEAYGMLSVVAQTFWDIEFLLEASPGDFYPSPKVASRVLVFQKKKNFIETLTHKEKKHFFNFVKAAFIHPRKLIASNLEETLGIKKVEVQRRLNQHHLPEKARPSQLKVCQFWEIYKEL